MDLATDRAGYKLKDHYDRDILGYMSGFEYSNSTGLWTARTTSVGDKAQTSADSDELLPAHKLFRDDFVVGGSASESISVGVAGTYDVTPLQLLNRMNRILDQKNVPTDGRWCVVDPVFLEKLLDENSKFMNHDYQATEALSNGRVSSAEVRGFRLYKSNNLPSIGTGPATIDTNGSDAHYGVIVAGIDAAVATASQLTKTESYRDPDSFADIVRGMQLYARKILRPEGLIRAAYNVNA